MKKKNKGYALAFILLFVFNSAYAAVDYSVILERNIFAEPPPPPEPPPARERTPIVRPPAPPALSSLIELRGIVFLKDGGSFVFIRNRRENRDSIYMEGDVVEKAEILKVLENEVIFNYADEEITLAIRAEAERALREIARGVSVQKDAPPETEPKSVIIPDDSADVRFEDPVDVNFHQAIAGLREDRDLMQNINVSPRLNDGNVEGFMVNNLPPGSIPHQYGLRDGDILRRVNGVFIDSVAKGFSVYNQIVRDGTDLVTVEVLRNNAPVVFTFRLR